MSVEKSGGVAVITWKHEEQNRFTTPFFDEFLAALDELGRDAGVRGVVLTSGLPKFFSNGLHLEWMMEQGAKDIEILVGFLRKVNETLIKTTSFQKPFVAAINGHAFAGGRLLIGKVKLGRNVTIGANAVLFPGVEVGDNSIVATLSTVPYKTKIPPNQVWAGNPARQIGIVTKDGRIKILKKEKDNPKNE